jgi:hypothetical protein
MSTEHEFVSHFIRRDRQQAYLKLLASPDRRRKFFGRLVKSCDLEPSVIEELHEDGESADAIAEILRSKGAGETCYAISEDAEIDGREVRLIEALQRVVARGRATLLSCVPGVLGYYEGADFEERCILHRYET